MQKYLRYSVPSTTKATDAKVNEILSQGYKLVAVSYDNFCSYTDYHFVKEDR